MKLKNHRLPCRAQTIGREERRVRVRQRLDLFLDGINDRRMAVAEAGNGGAAGAIEITFATRVDDVRSFAAHGPRRAMIEISVNGVAHGRAALLVIAAITSKH